MFNHRREGDIFIKTVTVQYWYKRYDIPLSIIASGVASLIITLSISFSALQFIEIADSVIEISHSLLHGGVPVDNPHLFKTLY